MAIEFDHLFVCTRVGAPEVDALVALGLTEGSANTHPGQGTTNRRIFFHNAMVEFLWVIDEDEVRSPVIAPTHLWERWHYLTTGYSPFGLGFRPHPAASSCPFDTWSYRPPYMPADLDIRMAANTLATEPLIFVIPFGARPDSLPAEQRQPLEHAMGFRTITGVRIMLPHKNALSPAVETLHMEGFVTFTSSDSHCAEIEFDGGKQGEVIDFRPALPLCFRW